MSETAEIDVQNINEWVEKSSPEKGDPFELNQQKQAKANEEGGIMQ